MAVAAMVARQMREQRCVNTPDESWTQEQMDLFELQRRSKATFKVFYIIFFCRESNSRITNVR